MLLFTVVLAMPCCRQTPRVGVACPHSRVYLRTEATQGRRSAQWEFSYQGNGRYVLYDKDVNGEIIIDVASAPQCGCFWPMVVVLWEFFITFANNSQNW